MICLQVSTNSSAFAGDAAFVKCSPSFNLDAAFY